MMSALPSESYGNIFMVYVMGNSNFGNRLVKAEPGANVTFGYRSYSTGATCINYGSATSIYGFYAEVNEVTDSNASIFHLPSFTDIHLVLK